MVLTEEQVKQIKKQLISQIEAGFPDDRKDYAKNQVEQMNSTQLEQFLEQNNLSPQQTSDQGKCIFCLISKEEIPSYRIGENEKAIAVLDIRPASYGHTLIIPRNHISSEKKLPKEAKALADQISKRIKEKLKPESVEIKNTNFFGHETINIVPHYKNETTKPLGEQREEAEEGQLQALQKELKKSLKTQPSKKQPKTKKQKKPEKPLKAPRRIP